MSKTFKTVVSPIITLLKFLKSEKYNVGIIDYSEDDLIKQSKKTKQFSFNKVKWVKNHSLLRWYADPFIYRVAEHEIEIFVEEYVFDKPGILTSLTIDRQSGVIKQKRTILRLDTHLSYPHIITADGVEYVCPESGAAGAIKIYKITPSGQLQYVKDIVQGSYADQSFYLDKTRGIWYMVATTPDYKMHLFKSPSLTGKWEKVSNEPIVKDVRYSRCGGSFFEHDGQCFRVAQDCKGVYGNSVHVMKVDSFEPYSETEIIHILPKSVRYNVGLHTLNFHPSGVAVIDGKGYNLLYFGQLMAKMLNPIFMKFSSLLN